MMNLTIRNNLSKTIFMFYPILLFCLLCGCSAPYPFNSKIPEIGDDGRYTAYQDGTVFDKKTGLMWSAKSSNDMSWQYGNTYCDKLNLGGYNDWRMPRSKELFSLIINPGPINKYGYQMTELIELSSSWIWTNEITRKSGKCTLAKAFHMIGFTPNKFCDFYNNRIQILPVRFASKN